VKRFEERHGRKLADIFPPEKALLMHTQLFPHNLIHAENVGGDIDQVLNRRVTIGAFPWRFVGGDACIARIVAFVEG
jgi:kynurenine formamidase